MNHEADGTIRAWPPYQACGRPHRTPRTSPEISRPEPSLMRRPAAFATIAR